jgi:hypothetical protein
LGGRCFTSGGMVEGAGLCMKSRIESRGTSFSHRLTSVGLGDSAQGGLQISFMHLLWAFLNLREFALSRIPG